MYMWRWAEKKHFIIKKKPILQNRATVLLQQRCWRESSSRSYAPEPQTQTLWWHPSATNLSKPKHSQSSLQPSSYRKEPINCSDGEHAGKLTPAVQAARSSESQCGWPKSALLFQLFIDRVQPLKWAHFHSKTVSQKYNR